TATPRGEGANLSEETRTIRGFDMYSDPPMADFLLRMFGCNEPGRGETAHRDTGRMWIIAACELEQEVLPAMPGQP
ncbi:MAG: hypothetical protein MR940_00890, partial [Lachnospiraceae bacterium]|nr:hypothetical protein [Lachnospiraceae bacterium]